MRVSVHRLFFENVLRLFLFLLCTAIGLMVWIIANLDVNVDNVKLFSRFCYASCFYLNFFAIVSLCTQSENIHLTLLENLFFVVAFSLFIQFVSVFEYISSFFFFVLIRMRLCENNVFSLLSFENEKQSANEDSMTLCEAHDAWSRSWSQRYT